jgi:hypothetical protein
MMITGRLWKDGTWWLAESEIAGVCTQGRSRKDAALMLADAFETLIDRPACTVTVTDDGRADGEVTIEASEPAALAAFILQRLRQSSGNSLGSRAGDGAALSKQLRLHQQPQLPWHVVAHLRRQSNTTLANVRGWSTAVRPADARRSHGAARGERHFVPTRDMPRFAARFSGVLR